MTYTPTSITGSVALPAATLQNNIANFRKETVSITTAAVSGITTDKIVSPRILQSTAEGYEAYFESGFFVSRKQPAADLRAPAYDGVWTAPAGWTFYDVNKTRNVSPASRPIDGVITRGGVPNTGATIYVQHRSYVIVSINFDLAPHPVDGVPDQTANNPKTLTCLIQHRDETGSTSGNWGYNINRQQPWIVLDSYLRNHTLRVAAVVDPGWHSWNLLVRDLTNEFAYSFVGATTTTIEGYDCLDT